MNIKLAFTGLCVLLLAVVSLSCQYMTEIIQPTFVPTVLLHPTETRIHPDSLDHTIQPTQMTLEATKVSTPYPPHASTPTAIIALLPSPTLAPMFTMTRLLSPTVTVEPTATYWPTVTRQILPANIAADLVSCEYRVVDDDLLLVVTQQFGLPQTYVPADLVLLTDYFPSELVRDEDLYIRYILIDPLTLLINEMQSVGLRPSFLSAYRSYNEQALAWRWWGDQYPDRVAIMSARAGYSEHQLGTTIDFGSPEINHLFHVDFATTTEGIWLANNAHHFGFTLSYPANSYDITGFKYEPWHYRYVGTQMAEQLFNANQILVAWQLTNMEPPCIP